MVPETRIVSKCCVRGKRPAGEGHAGRLALDSIPVRRACLSPDKGGIIYYDSYYLGGGRGDTAVGRVTPRRRS
jgi:hypothetical protein